MGCRLFLPPVNEVWGKVMFLHLSVSHYALQGVCLWVQVGCLLLGVGVGVSASGLGVSTSPWTHTHTQTHTHTPGHTHPGHSLLDIFHGIPPWTHPETPSPLWTHTPWTPPMDPPTPWTHTPLVEVVIQEGDTHPTGMYSCYQIF